MTPILVSSWLEEGQPYQPIFHPGENLIAHRRMPHLSSRIMSKWQPNLFAVLVCGLWGAPRINKGEPLFYGMNASVKSFCLFLEEADYSSYHATPNTGVWRATTSAPCCDEMCSLAPKYSIGQRLPLCRISPQSSGQMDLLRG